MITEEYIKTEIDSLVKQREHFIRMAEQASGAIIAFQQMLLKMEEKSLEKNGVTE